MILLYFFAPSASASAKIISGTVHGQNNQHINVRVNVIFYNRSHAVIENKNIFINEQIDPAGVVNGTRGTTHHWEAVAPDDTYYANVFVYPWNGKSYGGQSGYYSCAFWGVVVNMPQKLNGINLKLPLRRNTGGLNGYVFQNGRRLEGARVIAVSEQLHGIPKNLSTISMAGFGETTTSKNGYYKITGLTPSSLQGNKKYKIIVIYNKEIINGPASQGWVYPDLPRGKISVTRSIKRNSVGVKKSKITGAVNLYSKYFSGSIHGKDLKHLNVLVGIDLLDKNKKPILFNGKPKRKRGYSAYIWINSQINTKGVANNTYGTTHHFEMEYLPENANTVWVEVYPKNEDCVTTLTYYCRAIWHNIQLHRRGNPNINIRLSLNKAGKTGGFQGYIKSTDGRPLEGVVLSAFSMASPTWQNNPSVCSYAGLGFDPIKSRSNGYYRIDALSYTPENTLYKIYALDKGRIIVRYVNLRPSKVYGAVNFYFKP